MKNSSAKILDGFAMLEVLISILVIAFGLLGLAGLQGTSIRNNHQASLRGQATLYAYDIADRIRANRVGLDNLNYHQGTAGTAASTAACQPSSAPTGCTSAIMASYDLLTWGQMVSQLPGGQGIVCIDSTPGTPGVDTPAAPNCDGNGIQYIAKIWWRENSTGTPTQFNVVFQP